MLWWLVFAALVAVSLATRRAQQHRRALPGRTLPALASANLGLVQRLVGVDAAIEATRSVLELANPTTAQECAIAAIRRHAEPKLARQPIGPGTARIEELLVALAAISDEDRRDLADLGLDPHRIVAALQAASTPEQWLENLLTTLDYWQQTTTNLRARRYG